MFEERVDLSNDMTWRQMIAVGVRRVVLARGELDKLEGPKYAASGAELRRKAGEAASKDRPLPSAERARILTDSRTVYLHHPKTISSRK